MEWSPPLPSALCCIVGIDDALLIAAAASVASAGIGYMGQQSANSANSNINKSTMEFNWNSQQEAANRNVDMMRETSERNRYDAAANREWQDAAMTTARDWSATMSNTAYQRAMQDMRAAGLNPLLAYQQGGASSPIAPVTSGAQATSSGAGSPAVGASSQLRMENALGPALASGMQGARTVMDLKQLAAQTDQTRAQTALTNSAEAQARSQTSLNSAQTVSELRRADLISNQAAESAAMPALRGAQTSAASAQATLDRERAITERERPSQVREETRAAGASANYTRTQDVQRQTYGPPGAISGTVGGISQIVDSIRRSLQ